MDIINNRPTGRPSTPDSRCSICFDDLTNKCYTNACLHLFCFECLQQWSNSEPTCPLCKKTFNYIYHSFGYFGVHKTYSVPIMNQRPCQSPRSPRSPSPNNVRSFSESSNGSSGMDSVVNINRGNERLMSALWSVYELSEVDHNHGQFYHHQSQSYSRLTSQRPIIGQAMRMQVYIDNVWAEPLPDTTGRFRHCSRAFYRDNPTQMYRLHKFILRDVVAIRQCVRSEGQSFPFPENTDINVTIMIMRSLVAYEIRQLHLVNNLRPFLYPHALQFWHELYNFATSPHDIIVYDSNVQYTHQAHASEFTVIFYQPSPPIHVVGETVALESDNVEFGVNTDDSDDEFLSHSFRSINLVNSVSIDQPATGIRSSLDRPTTSFESEYGGLSQMSHASHERRVYLHIIDLDSSSDDQE